MIAKSSRPHIKKAALALALIVFASPLNAQPSKDLVDAFGLRIGVIGNAFWSPAPPVANTFDPPPATNGVRPLVNPYYEVALLPGMTASANLMLVYRSFAVFGLSDIQFQSYGFNCSVRWEPSIARGEPMDERHYFLSAGLGFDTFTDRVSVSLPLSVGELFPLSQRMELELAGLVTYQQFLELGPGMYFGITAGIRFLNFE